MSAVEAALVDLIRTVVREELEGRPATAQEWFTVAEAADYLRVSPRDIERRIERKEICSSLLGRRRIIRRAWLDEHAAAREDP